MWVGKRSLSAISLEMGRLYDSGVRILSPPSLPVPPYYILRVHRDIMLVPGELRSAYYTASRPIDVVVGDTVMAHPQYTDSIGNQLLIDGENEVMQCKGIGPLQVSWEENGFLPGVITTCGIDIPPLEHPSGGGLGSTPLLVYYVGVDFFLWNAAYVIDWKEHKWYINPRWLELWEENRSKVGLPESYPPTNALAAVAMLITLNPEYSRGRVPGPIYDYIMEQEGMEALGCG